MYRCVTSDLGEVAAEAGGPAALGAGPHAARVLLAEDPVAAQRVGAPRQVGAALHVASQQGVLVLSKSSTASNTCTGRAQDRVSDQLRYLGNSVLVRQDAEEEQSCRLSLTVRDWTVTVHDQVLLDPRRQVLLPARL